MQTIIQRLAAYEQERSAADAALRDHYGLNHKPWPWEEKLPEVRLAADTLVTLADSIKIAVAQRALHATATGTSPSKGVEVRVNTQAEAAQLRMLLPADVREHVEIHVSEDSHVDSEQYARV